MEFKGQYLTYTEYSSLGGTLDITPFNLLEFEAQRRVDIATQNRLKGTESENVPQEVKLCIYNLINAIENYSSSTKKIAEVGNAASESIDGYSISYIKPTEIKDIVNSKSVELDDIITTYLLGVVFNKEHLMYLGTDRREQECLSTVE